MKQISFFFAGISLISLIACSGGGNSKNSDNTETNDSIQIPLTTIEFETKSHDFGEIEQGEKVSYTYKFKNTGENNLVISKVTPTCGCTVPDWSKDPIKPQEEGKIKVVFNSKGRKGIQRKSVGVVANTHPSTIVLSFMATIKEQEN